MKGSKTPQDVRYRVLQLYMQGLSGAIISQRIGVPKGTVYGIIREAKTAVPFSCPDRAI